MTFLDTLTNSRADYCVVHSFPALHSDITKVSLVLPIAHQKLSVLCTGHGRMYVSHRLFFLSVWSELLIM